jgi:hypothetical protein
MVGLCGAELGNRADTSSLEHGLFLALISQSFAMHEHLLRSLSHNRYRLAYVGVFHDYEVSYGLTLRQSVPDNHAAVRCAMSLA